MRARGWALVGALISSGSTAQEPTPVPGSEFASNVERIYVDVVVADKQGQPVTGLTLEDFTLFEDGRPTPIATLDVVAPRSSTDIAPPRAPYATNVVPATERGRTFVMVFDDMHMSPGNARRAKAAVAELLQRGTHDGDRITLVSTAGAAWWSTRLPEGREDLFAILKRLDGRRVPESGLERVSDYEALKIFIYRDSLIGRRVRDRLERYSTRSREEMMNQGRDEADQTFMRSEIDPYVMSRASETYFKLRAKLEVSLTAVLRAIKAVEGGRDRKSLVLVSEGFVYDTTLPIFKQVTEAARRSNVALYFVDTRGLEALGSAYGAEFGAALDERNLLAAIADVSLDGEGAEYLSDETGGFSVRRTNDLAAGALRIGQESESYYLIGYDLPVQQPRDGRFHRIEVRVKGSKGQTVRARRGYFAPSDSGEPPAASPSERDPAIQRALDSPASVDGLPLRMTVLTLDERTAGRARVVVGAEVDVTKASFTEKDGQVSTVLDTLTVLAHRDSGEFFRNDQRAELGRRPGGSAQGPLWYTFVREFELAPGAYQAKLIVRDAATQKVGSVVSEFKVPALDQLRLSTPIVSDALQTGSGATGTPAVMVRRDFARAGFLYCLFDVYGATKDPEGRPRVTAWHELRRAGVLLGRTPPKQIEPTSLGALVRLIQLPLSSFSAGEYELKLMVKDELSGETRETVEPFTVRN